MIKAKEKIMRLQKINDTMKGQISTLKTEIERMKEEKRSKMNESISLEGLKVILSFILFVHFARFRYCSLII